ncbi:hypothetical protein RB213_010619, partial [Colletotrichum asianum]
LQGVVEGQGEREKKRCSSLVTRVAGRGYRRCPTFLVDYNAKGEATEDEVRGEYSVLGETNICWRGTAKKAKCHAAAATLLTNQISDSPARLWCFPG